MGTTSQKLTYLNETKQELKQKINNLGGSIDDNTTFRQYADKLQTIYNNAPKTSYAEGSNITLSNCLKGKLDYEDGKVGYGDTYQESTTGKNKFGFGISAIDVTSTYRPIANQRLDVTGINLNEVKFTYRGGTYGRAYFEINGIDGTSNYSISFNVKENTTSYTPTYTIDTTNSTNTKLIFYISGGNGATPTANTDYFILSDIQVESGNSVTSFEKYTGGQASPNPSYPQEIKCVAGRNRFNVNNATQIGNGTAQTIISPNEIDFISGTGVWSNYAYIFKNPEKNTDFTIKAKFKSALARTTGISVYGSDTNDVSNLTNIKADTSNLTANTEKEYSVTFNSGNYNYICFRFWNNYSATALSENVTLNIYEIQLEEGTQPTPYLPYNTIEEVVSGKNLFDYSTNIIANAFPNNSTMKIASDNNCKLSYIQCKPNTTYTISRSNPMATRFSVSTTNGLPEIDTSLLSFDYNNTGTSITITTPSNANYIVVRFIYNEINDYETYAKTIQIEQGSTATTYEPYITPTSYQLSLGDKKLYDECAIVGSPDNWKFVDNYYKEKFNQTTVERATTNTNNKYRFKITPTQQVKSTSLASEVADILSNIATKESANATYSCENGIAISSTGSIFIYQDSFSAYTGDQMRSYFANNDDYIVYPLATPIETPITDETLISQLNAWYNAHSLNGTTIITSNGNLPMIIKVRGLKGE